MGQRAVKTCRATYADLEAVPPNKVAELIGGVLHVMPRPAPRHANTSSVLGIEIGGPFQRGRGGPGGWWILDEPELQFPDPAARGEVDVVVPDIAGWRRERMPELPETAYFPLAPDWICEVLSPSTERVDREEKMPVYAREGVRHAWLVDPVKRTLETFSLVPGPGWERGPVHRDAARVRLAPFEAIELDLSVLWAT
ncbi:Uma2 family endonuclease [Sorangium cellulosum]|uniref:Uma2 family endonuclease n=1 Tax=Sorangium cellulosum TaxID=56 RepID=UPI003D9A9821